MPKRRQYNTLGRRILNVLDFGPRKTNVLRGLAPKGKAGDSRFLHTIKRLRGVGSIVLVGTKRGALWHRADNGNPRRIK